MNPHSPTHPKRTSNRFKKAQDISQSQTAIEFFLFFKTRTAKAQMTHIQVQNLKKQVSHVS